MNFASSVALSKGSRLRVDLLALPLAFLVAVMNPGCSQESSVPLSAVDVPAFPVEEPIVPVESPLDPDEVRRRFRSGIVGEWIPSPVVAYSNKRDSDYVPNDVRFGEIGLDISPSGEIRLKQRLHAEALPYPRFRDGSLIHQAVMDWPSLPQPVQEPEGKISGKVPAKGLTVYHYSPKRRERLAIEVDHLTIVSSDESLVVSIHTKDGWLGSVNCRKGVSDRRLDYTLDDWKAERRATYARACDRFGPLVRAWIGAEKVESTYRSWGDEEGRQAEEPSAYIRGKAIVIHDDNTPNTPSTIDQVDEEGMLLLPADLRAEQPDEMGTLVHIRAARLTRGVYAGTQMKADYERWTVRIVDLLEERLIAEVEFITKPRESIQVFPDQELSGQILTRPDAKATDYLRRLARRPLGG